MMDIGIVYHIETPQQFWSELEDIISLPPDASLALIDSRVMSFVSFCATYHEKYLSTPAQMDYCCHLLIESDYFEFHSERTCDLLLNNALVNTDPHTLLMLYNIFLAYGLRHASFFRSTKRWQPHIPLLMDHILYEVEESMAEVYIEAKIRVLAVELLYELCRVQKLSAAELRVFTDAFISHMFELVESTRSNETLSYLLIKFIVSLNEQFMVASIPSKGGATASDKKSPTNQVMEVLMRRLHSSKTFGENLIFMLNRANGTDEDLVMQLLILKMLYLLFTTPGTQEYFYTNDLRVLVDVFVRELNNLSEENESLRHTYLRVLHPLLNNTQLRTNPYKPFLIRNTLHNAIAHSHIRDIDPTTKRLVERCLNGEWCKSLPSVNTPSITSTDVSAFSPITPSPTSPSVATTMHLTLPDATLHKPLARSASVEVLSPRLTSIKEGEPTRPASSMSPFSPTIAREAQFKPHGANPVFTLSHEQNHSSTSLASVAEANDLRAPHPRHMSSTSTMSDQPTPESSSSAHTLYASPPTSPISPSASPPIISHSPLPIQQHRSTRRSPTDPQFLSMPQYFPPHERTLLLSPTSPMIPSSSSIASAASDNPTIHIIPTTSSIGKKTKPPPPPPPKQRRKPPPVPSLAVPSAASRSAADLPHGGVTMHTIASSSTHGHGPSPLRPASASPASQPKPRPPVPHRMSSMS